MKQKIKFIIILFIISCILLTYSIFIEPYWIKINFINIKNKDIPNTFIDKKIIFISDIHHGPYFSIGRVKKLVDKINKLKPDIIILGGDYVHRDKKYIIPCFNELKNLNSKFGVFGVLGNHDHWESEKQTLKSMQKANIKILKNNGYWIKIKNTKIKIVGVGDLWEDNQNLNYIIKDVKKNDFVILVSHNPDYFEKIKNNTLIDLVLSGHTHGGQVTLFGCWAPLLPSKYGQKYRYGIQENNNNKIIITSGIGTITPPVRFFARPEIVILNLKNK